jgi:hypothetical protein
MGTRSLSHLRRVHIAGTKNKNHETGSCRTAGRQIVIQGPVKGKPCTRVSNCKPTHSCQQGVKIVLPRYRKD